MPGSLAWRTRNVVLGSVLGAAVGFPLGNRLIPYTSLWISKYIVCAQCTCKKWHMPSHWVNHYLILDLEHILGSLVLIMKPLYSKIIAIEVNDFHRIHHYGDNSFR